MRYNDLNIQNDHGNNVIPLPTADAIPLLLHPLLLHLQQPPNLKLYKEASTLKLKTNMIVFAWPLIRQQKETIFFIFRKERKKGSPQELRMDHKRDEKNQKDGGDLWS